MMHANFQHFLAVVIFLCIAPVIEAQTNYIQVVSESGVSVFLDGLFKGKTTDEMGGFIVENVSSGTHTIKVVKTGFDPLEEKIIVKSGEVFVHTVKPFVTKTKTVPTDQSPIEDNSIKTEIKPISKISVDKDGPMGTFKDPRDGEVYNIVTIGVQTWMAENLRTTKYNDGTSIPLVSDNKIWKNSSTDGFCWNMNDEAKYKTTYGGLYNGYAVSTGKLCPTGWHIPSISEWQMLIDSIGGVKIAGGKLKEPGSTHWVRPNRGASNETGFTALPGGWRFGKNGQFCPVGVYCIIWSSTRTSSSAHYTIVMHYSNNDVIWQNNSNSEGYSVRCLRDY